MGVKGEKARQSCWCWTKTGRTLAPVKAERCQKMFDECTAFSKRLNTCEKQIRDLKKATDGLVQISEKVLSQPLPKVWDIMESGEVIAVPGTGSPLIMPGQLQRSHSLDLQAKVFDPIGGWQTEYTRMKGRMVELQNQSLRVDAARREHYKGSQKHLKENVMKADNVAAAPPRELDDAKLQNARASYQKLEGDIHHELQRLCESAKSVQEYLTKAMELQADTLHNAASTHAQSSFRGSQAGTPVAGTPTAGSPLSPISPPVAKAV